MDLGLVLTCCNHGDKNVRVAMGHVTEDAASTQIIRPRKILGCGGKCSIGVGLLSLTVAIVHGRSWHTFRNDELFQNALGIETCHVKDDGVFFVFNLGPKARAYTQTSEWAAL
jgi:hypothetical protein